MNRMTDREYAGRLLVRAGRALRKNRARRFQRPWAESALVPEWDELLYMQALAPSVVLRLMRRLHRLEGWSPPLTEEAVDVGDYA